MATVIQSAYEAARAEGKGHQASLKAVTRRYPGLTTDDVQNALDRASDDDRRGKPRKRDWYERPNHNHR